MTMRTKDSKQRALLLVACLALVGLLVGFWSWASREGGPPPAETTTAVADATPPVLGELERPALPAASEAAGGENRSSVVDAVDAADTDVDSTHGAAAAPDFDVVVEGIPGLRSGRCVITARFFAGAEADEALDGQALSPIDVDGRAHLATDDPQIAASATHVAFRFMTGVPGGFNASLVESSGQRARFPLDEGGGWTLRPDRPLAGVCVTDESGEILWNETLTHNGGFASGATRGVGWLAFRRESLERIELLAIGVGSTTYKLPGDLYPIDDDGLMRLPLAELGRWDRTLVVQSEMPLPAGVRLRIDRELRGEFHTYDSGKPGARTLSVVNEDSGWTVRRMPPGTYRVMLDLAGPLGDGIWYVGEADLVHAARVVLDVPPFEQHRLSLRLAFAEGFDDRDMLPWRLQFDGERVGAGWLLCKDRKLAFEWLGPLPTHVRITGREGPLHPTAFPLEWNAAGHAVLDLTHESLRRCKIDAPEDGTPLFVQEPARTRLGGPPASTLRPWTLLSAKDALWELCWWNGAEFEVPLLERDAEAFSAAKELVLFDALSPERIAGRERFVPRRLPGRSENVVLLSRGRANLVAFAWLPSEPPSDVRSSATFVELQESGDWLFLGLKHFERREELVVPAQANGLLLLDQITKQRAYLVRGAWGAEIRLEDLDWR
ncbi:MAG: hypothetical protein H6831_16310 [Planctomycetes bacterium]|nr:hypothetical protein [Planctomycetota bacterium]MCB9905964.1 hypothetical protein [Planctomycetota bacterium]